MQEMSGREFLDNTVEDLSSRLSAQELDQTLRFFAELMVVCDEAKISSEALRQIAGQLGGAGARPISGGASPTTPVGVGGGGAGTGTTTSANCPHCSKVINLTI